MKEIRTVCARDCYDTCFLVAGTDAEGRLVSVKGDPGHPVTRGITCPRGAKDAHRVYHNRIRYPHVRSGAKPGRHFSRVDWDHALDRAAEKLAHTLETWGPERVLVLKYAGNTGLLAGAFPMRLWNALGAVQTDNGLCSQSGHFGLGLHYGSSYGIRPEQLPHYPLIVFWGFNAAVSAPHIWHLASEARKASGSQIVVIDARASETARRADIWLQPKPGTDAALANGIAARLIEQGRIDSAFIQAWTYGFEPYREEIIRWTPAAVEAMTGIDWTAVDLLAAAYGKYRPSATLIGVGLQKSFGGADAVRAASILPALVGQHRGFFYSNKTGFSIDTAYLSGQRLAKTSAGTTSQVGISEPVAAGRYKFIYVSGMNPAMTVPGQNRLRQGFCREDVFVAVHDSNWTETADFADLVLPAQTYLEKADVVIPWAHGFIRKSNPATDPLAESRHEIDVMTALAERIGLRDRWVFEDPWQALETACGKAFSDGTFKDLMAGKTLTLRYASSNRYPTATGRIELWSKTAEAAGVNPVPEAFPVAVEKGRYLLLNSAVPSYTHSQFQEAYGPIPPLVWIHPDDAARLGVADGQTVVLENDAGETAARAEITDRVPEGVLWAPHEFTGLDGKAQNSVTPAVPQRAGGGSAFNSTVVSIRPRE